MGLSTPVPFADVTWEPFQGCSPVSEGCANCYPVMMFKMRKVQRVADHTFNLPLRKYNGKWSVKPGSIVFVCSRSDLFYEKAPDKWRFEVFDIMAQRPDVTFLLLTKRVDAMATMLRRVEPQPHIAIGITAENQHRLAERLPTLLSIDWPGFKFVSLMPLLSDITFTPAQLRALDWVILGGESGKRARPMLPAWPRHVRDQCEASRIPFFFSQWGDWCPYPSHTRLIPQQRTQFKPLSSTHPDEVALHKVGIKSAGVLLDGTAWREYPYSTRRRLA